MPAPYDFLILAAAWAVWLTPFFLAERRTTRTAIVTDRRARWGILLQAVAYALLWLSPFWQRAPELWRSLLALVFFALAAVLSWNSVYALGKQWRIDAGLNADHQLVRAGPYQLVRHPIYTSMLCVLLGTGSLFTPLPLLILALFVFLIGTEIRVRLEDALLASRFGDDFAAYRRAVSAYIPFAHH